MMTMMMMITMMALRKNISAYFRVRISRFVSNFPGFLRPDSGAGVLAWISRDIMEAQRSW